MKYRLIIDKQAEEEIIAVVHEPSALTEQIENLVCNFTGTDSEDSIRPVTSSLLTYSIFFIRVTSVTS